MSIRIIQTDQENELNTNEKIIEIKPGNKCQIRVNDKLVYLNYKMKISEINDLLCENFEIYGVKLTREDPFVTLSYNDKSYSLLYFKIDDYPVFSSVDYYSIYYNHIVEVLGLEEVVKWGKNRE